MDEPWPTGTPRDDLLVRVASSGAHRLRVRRLSALALAGTGVLVVAACVGFAMGRSDSVDLMQDSVVVSGTPYPTIPDSACDADVLDAPGCDQVGQPLPTSDQTTTTLSSDTHAGETTTTTEPDDSTSTTRTGGTTATTKPPTKAPSKPTKPTKPTTPTTRPTTPTTRPPSTTTTTTGPDTADPVVSGLSKGGVGLIHGNNNGVCAGTSAPVSALVVDQSALKTVFLSWSYKNNTGTQSTGKKVMTLSGGRYRANLGLFSNKTIPTSGTRISWWVTATDVHGNSAPKVVAPASEQVNLDKCV